MRVLAWNIRAGGGRRADAIAAWVAAQAPDVVVLSEFRASGASTGIARGLAGSLPHQKAWFPGSPAGNGLLLAARLPFEAIAVAGAPEKRWLAARFADGFTVAGIHVPNVAPDRARKERFRAAVVAAASGWPEGPGLIVGDTNSGRPLADEENGVFGRQDAAWFEALEGAGWRDVFRHLHSDAREFTWYSPNAGNGFRIDQGFANEALLGRVRVVRHVWAERGGRRDGLSDHAALLIDFDDS